MKANQKTFETMLKKLRNNKTALAEECGIDYNTLVRILKGKEVIEATIAQCFYSLQKKGWNISYSQLVTGKDAESGINLDRNAEIVDEERNIN